MSKDNNTNLTIIDHGEGDEPQINYSLNPTFAAVLEARLARRSILKGGAGAAALGFLGLGLAGCNSGSSSSDDPQPAPTPGPASPEPTPRIGFNAVAVSEADTIVVPEGYSYQVMAPWGEPILGTFPTFALNNTGADQAEQVGMHHDGMHFFPIEGDDPYEGSSTDGLLVMNHEYIEPRFMHEASLRQPLGSGGVLQANGVRDADEVLKEINAHGVSVMRIRKGVDNRWQIQADALNRRITGLTPMQIQGPARGSALLRTKYSPNGTMTRGTLNNCAHGVTPWNTYMAAEENWAGYFRNGAGADSPREHANYGINSSPTGTGRYAWELAAGGADEFVRFDASIKGATPAEDYRNEPNCFGWMVEIDPFDPDSIPVKRTALGRFGHEGVVFAPAEEGKPVVCYSGDDSTNQHIYKFVSEETYNRATASGRLLDKGTLYVARFNEDGSGEWLPLVFGQPGLTAADGFANQADVLVNTRLAAQRVGATPMDRPEWGAVDPANGDVYFTLTNNSGRKVADAANPRTQNLHGHIIRWAEQDGDHSSSRFEWDIFLFAGDAGESGEANLAGRDPNGAPLTAASIMSSPDGLWIDRDSRVWIQTDIGEGSQNTGPFKVMGNNSMFAADPETGEIRRFLTGPVGQEITGCITTPDQKTMFINVQHPGATTTAQEWEQGIVRSSWPDNNSSLYPPRSATVVIWKNDGGVIGS